MNRRNTSRRRQVGPAVDGRDREIELGAVGLAGQRDANRMKERLPLLPGLRLHAHWPPRGTARDRAAVPRTVRRRAHSSSRAQRPRVISARIASSASVASAENVNSTRAAPEPGPGDRPSRSQSASPRRETPAPSASGVIGNARRREIRQRQLRKARRVGQLEIVAVHPRELLLVEHAGAQADVVERKASRHLLDRQQLLVVSRRPADEREVVDERLRQIALAIGIRRPTSRRAASTAACDRGP